MWVCAGFRKTDGMLGGGQNKGHFRDTGEVPVSLPVSSAKSLPSLQ